MLLAHPRDDCSVTAPKDLPLVVDKLTGTARKKVVELADGTPKGNRCDHEAAHGFGGLDGSAIQAISDFILQ